MPDYKGLGRGLGSLIPAKPVVKYKIKPGQKPVAAQTPAPTTAVKNFPLSVDRKVDNTGVLTINPEQIEINPWQPRTHFDSRKLEELTASIKKHGIIQPLIVTQNAAGTYQLVAGERRLRAARALGLTAVPAIVRKAADLEKLELALIENIQREDLNPLEEARAYQRLIDEFNLTQEQLAERVGKNRSVIANSLRLLSLPDVIQKALISGQITVGHAKALLSFDSAEKQLQEFEKIKKAKLSVRQVEEQSQRTKKRGTTALHPDLQHYEEKLRTTLMTKVKIQDRMGMGKVVIDYYSPEELGNIVKIITR